MGLDAIYNKWLSIQPLTEAEQNMLSMRFTVEYNYNSNHLEGNTLTYGQTELLLLFGKVSGEGHFFYSILDYMKRKYGFDIKINYHFNLIPEVEFENYLDYYGIIRMKEIRYKYFSDKDLLLWTICNDFFERMSKIHSGSLYQDYLMVTDYHVVFEAMVDR